VTFAPGELVDPLNDLIERFSWIMLLASTSLGMQKILMEISAWWGLQALVAVAGAGWIALRLVRRGEASRSLLLRLFLVVLFLRLAMPLMVILNHAVYDGFMAADYLEATSVLEETSESLEDMQAESRREMEASQTEGGEGPGFFDSVGRWFDDTTDAMDIEARLAAYREKLGNATEHLLRLAAVFILQTCILPLAFLWLFARSLGPLFGLLRSPLAGTSTPPENR